MSQSMIPQQENKPLKLLNLMVQAFNLDEIKALCFELNINYEGLGDNMGLRNRVIALIQYAQRNQRLGDLNTTLQRNRPAVDWPRLEEDSEWGTVEDNPASSSANAKPSPTINVSGNISAGQVNIGGEQTFENSINIDMRQVRTRSADQEQRNPDNAGKAK